MPSGGDGVVRVTNGDEISIGSILAVVGMTSGLRRTSPIAEDVRGEARLVAEVDRSVRYHRPLTVGLIRCGNDAVVDAMARSLRPMDLMAEDAGDDYLDGEGVSADGSTDVFNGDTGVPNLSDADICITEGAEVRTNCEL